MRRLALLVVVSAASCGAAQRREEPAPPSVVDEDLVALLPSGAEAVIDIDVAQLRRWPPARRLWRLLSDSAHARAGRLGFDPLDDADLLAVALRGAGTESVELTLIARGRFDPAHLRAALAQGEGAEEIEYHGSRLVDGARSALAMITERSAVFGSRVEVRRVVDVALGNDEGLRRGDADRTLRDALRRSPEAKDGRPAIIAALLPPPALHARLAENHVPVELIDWISVAVAVGDGIDIGVVAAARDPARADQLAARLRLQLDDLKVLPSVRALGLAPFVEVVRIGKKNNEVHLAFRLEQQRFDRLVARLGKMFHFATAAAGGGDEP